MELNILPKLAFEALNEAEQSFIETGSISNKCMEILHSFFGEHFALATELLEKCQIIEYRLENNLRNVFKIVTNREQYTIFENINFCSCNVFRLKVLEYRKAVTCKHVLAVKLGKIIGNVCTENVEGLQLLEFLKEQLKFIELNDQ